MWTLASPAMLAGLLLLALPVIAHILQQRLRNYHVFPSVRFFRTDARGHRSRNRLRQWLLLLLRSLCVVAVVLAFARPGWWRSADSAYTPGQGATVILLDVTPSMGRRAGGVPLFEEALSACRRAVKDAEREGDRVNVIPIDLPAEPLLPGFPAHPSALLAELDALTPSPRRASPAIALRKALQLLQEHEGPGRLILISDFQSNNWPKSLGRALPETVTWIRVDLSEGPFPNLAVQDPHVRPSRPVAGQPVQLSVDVVNSGSDTLDTTLRVLDGDAELHRRRVSVPGNSRRTETFTHTFETDGIHTLDFDSSGSDALAYDNRCGVAVPVGSRPEVRLVSDTDPHRPGTAAYYLLRALAPRATATDPWQVQVLRGSRLESGVPPRTRAVVLGGAAALTPEGTRALTGYLSQGGNLVVFAADPGFKGTARLLDQALSGGVLPWTPGTLLHHPPDEPARLSEPGRDVPVMRGFDPGLGDTFAGLPLLTRWTVATAHPEGRTVLQFTDGVPAVSLRTLATGGRCLVVNASPDQRHGAFGASGFFVALVQSLLEETRTDTGSQAVHPGEPLTTVIPRDPDLSPRTARLIDPDGVPVFDAEFLLTDTALTCRAPSVRKPGIYQITIDGQTVDAVRVNPHPHESSPHTLSAAERDALFPSPGETRNPGALSAGESLSPPRITPLWGWFLLGALGLLTLESAWLAWGRR
jgi:hypothetical protein